MPVADKSSKEPKKEAVPKKSDSTNTVESDSESEGAFLMTYDDEQAHWLAPGKHNFMTHRTLRA